MLYYFAFCNNASACVHVCLGIPCVSLMLHTYTDICNPFFANLDGCPKLLVSVCGNVDRVTWPETEIGQEASVPCPCGLDDPMMQQLRSNRRCGGTYEGGAEWEEPQCDSCMFSNTRREICALAEVG